jgi:hypothetical protein
MDYVSIRCIDEDGHNECFLDIWVAFVTNGDWKRISITNLLTTKNIWLLSNNGGALDGY